MSHWLPVALVLLVAALPAAEGASGKVKIIHNGVTALACGVDPAEGASAASCEVDQAGELGPPSGAEVSFGEPALGASGEVKIIHSNNMAALTCSVEPALPTGLCDGTAVVVDL